jgi:phosphoglycerate dehydrogenase-like enzyme
LEGGRLKVVFGEPDKMFRLIAEALSPSKEGEQFLCDFYLTEIKDPVATFRAWSSRRGIPRGIQVEHCNGGDDLKRMIVDADALVVENAPVDAEHIESARSLKLIQMFGRETSNIDRAACARKNIVVRPLNRYSNRLVTEHVIMLMLALSRGLDESRAAMGQPSSLPPSSWAFNWPACRSVKGLADRVVGLVGLGQIGLMVADYLRPFGAKVLYTKRSRDRAAEQRFDIEYATLNDLVSQADVLSLHVPGNEQTRNLVDAKLLARAKSGLMLVNTARGCVIDESALVEALRTRRIGGAALDVFAHEPLRMDHPLRSLDNVILTPHVAAGSRDDLWLDREIGPVIDAVVAAVSH